MAAEMFLLLALLCGAIVLWRYWQSRRVVAGIGWALMIAAIGASGAGLSGAFTWAGLLFVSIGVLGLVLVIQEAIYRRHDRRKHAPRFSRR